MDTSKYFGKHGALLVDDIVISLWSSRGDPASTERLTQLLISSLDEIKSYRKIESYLPQLSHMTINSSPQAYPAMENLLCSISSFSMYAGLILTYNMVAALEDYQPEDATGMRNPASDNMLFQRCTKLLQMIERSVVEKEFKPSIIDSTPQLVSKVGWLFYKRITRRTSCSLKGWKRRFFSVLNGVLMCYSDDTYTVLKRAMPLVDCSLQVIENKKHGNYFEVFSSTTGTKYQLYAENPEERASWISVLTW